MYDIKTSNVSKFAVKFVINEALLIFGSCNAIKKKKKNSLIKV